LKDGQYEEVATLGPKDVRLAISVSVSQFRTRILKANLWARSMTKQFSDHQLCPTCWQSRGANEKIELSSKIGHEAGTEIQERHEG
jgi:hypothetical protein